MYGSEKHIYTLLFLSTQLSISPSYMSNIIFRNTFNQITRSTPSVTARMSSNISSTLNQNEHGQGATHASGGAQNSKVPDVVQDKAPKGLEEALPDSVRPYVTPFLHVY
jgi:hypothetical protein